MKRIASLLLLGPFFVALGEHANLLSASAAAQFNHSVCPNSVTPATGCTARLRRTACSPFSLDKRSKLLIDRAHWLWLSTVVVDPCQNRIL